MPYSRWPVGCCCQKISDRISIGYSNLNYLSARTTKKSIVQIESEREYDAVCVLVEVDIPKTIDSPDLPDLNYLKSIVINYYSSGGYTYNKMRSELDQEHNLDRKTDPIIYTCCPDDYYNFGVPDLGENDIVAFYAGAKGTDKLSVWEHNFKIDNSSNINKYVRCKSLVTSMGTIGPGSISFGETCTVKMYAVFRYLARPPAGWIYPLVPEDYYLNRIKTEYGAILTYFDVAGEIVN